MDPVLKPVRDDLSLPAETVEYTVQKGDSLSRIASKYKVSLDDLRKANGLRKDTIFVGQSLLIPSPKVTNGVQAAEVEHSAKQVEVKAGDSLSRIAARIGTTVSTLKQMNGLTSDRIYVGQKLAVPESSNVSAPSPAPQPVRTTSVSVASAAGQKTYKVQPGDTPGGIARKFGISATELMAANGITDARKLYAGKEIMIPVSGSVTSQPATQPVATQPVPLTTRSDPSTTSPQPAVITEPASTADDISMLEALEDEDLPFVEVEAVGTEPGN
jgi:LysM repeat protein